MASGDIIDSIEIAETSLAIPPLKEVNNEVEIQKEDKIATVTFDKLENQDNIHIKQYGAKSRIPKSKIERERDRERKIGHRRVGVGGEITYKKIETRQIMGSIQLGIQHAVGGLASKPERDLLMQDFMTVETTTFPSEGSSHTPAHHYSEFKFKNYAPIAFRYFRELFGIQPDDFLMSMCSCPLRELSNPGASGSIFYLTDDDEFIVKTVQHKEGEFLQKLLAGYYMNLNQNPRTLLPKFFGLYCYQCNSKNIRLVIMNNLLPSWVRMHQKYDLKGSTYKRKASKSERQKRSPTYKDLDFMEHHPEGILMEADTYAALVKTIQRDCRVLESFKIMDYSLLVGIHNLDQAQREKLEEKAVVSKLGEEHYESEAEHDFSAALVLNEREREKEDRLGAAVALNRTRSINRQRLVAHSTAMESIQAESEPIDEEDDVPPGGIPARNAKGERLLLFVGIIDILQSYRLKKKLEHTWKSMIHDGDTVSVHRPSFYAQRFQEFMAKQVFKKIPSLDLPEVKGNHRKFRTLVTSYIALKHSPSKRKSLSRPLRSYEDVDNSTTSQAQINSNHQNGNKIVTPTETLPAKVMSPSSVSSTVTSTPVPLSSPPSTSYPSILVGRHTTNNSDHKPKVPPPVPPRGTPKSKKAETSNKGDLLENEHKLTHGVQMHALLHGYSVNKLLNKRNKTRLKLSSFSARDAFFKKQNFTGLFNSFNKKSSKTFPCTSKYVVTNKNVLYFNSKYSNSFSLKNNSRGNSARVPSFENSAVREKSFSTPNMQISHARDASSSHIKPRKPQRFRKASESLPTITITEPGPIDYDIENLV